MGAGSPPVTSWRSSTSSVEDEHRRGIAVMDGPGTTFDDLAPSSSSAAGERRLGIDVTGGPRAR